MTAATGFQLALPLPPGAPSPSLTRGARRQPQFRRPNRPSATIAAPESPAPAPSEAPWMPLPGVVHEIRTAEQFDLLAGVARDGGALLVVDFMAAWCRKCLYLLPRVRKVAAALPDVYYCAVDVNKVARLPQEFAVTKMPTLVFLKGGERVGTVIGGGLPTKVGAEVEAAVRKYRSAE